MSDKSPLALLEYESQAIVEISTKEYEAIVKLVHDRCGINLGANKLHLVQARLGKRIRSGHFKNFSNYYKYVMEDKTGQEIASLIDAISTNTTHFFREKDHFEFLANDMSRRISNGLVGQRHCFRIWSAACSSGEEAYSLAMTVHEVIRNSRLLSAKILATDICRDVLEKAERGIYSELRLGTVPERYLRTYLVRIRSDGEAMYKISDSIMQMVKFAHFNLMMGQFPFRYGFDYIFCRNVMIYFDRKTQEQLLKRLYEHLIPGGYLLVGHCESLNSIRHRLKYIQPTVYQKLG